MVENEVIDIYQKIGIDKIQFYGLGLERDGGIDFTRLMRHECVSIEEAGAGIACVRYLPNTNRGISKITIKDNQVFSDLLIGCSRDGKGRPHEYIYLIITVDNARGDNLEPMSYIEYSFYLENVISYIADTYGIYLHSDLVKVKYMEINTNILLSKKFSEYNRAFRLLMSFPDKKFGKLSTYDSVSKNKKNTTLNGESYKRGNKSIELILYDKSRQTEDKWKKAEAPKLPQYLRIEYRLLNPKKVEAELGSSHWKDLSDNIIADWFVNKFKRQILDKYAEWEEERQKALLKLISKCRRKNPKTWHHLLMQEIRNISEINGISYILDIEQVHEAIRHIPNSGKYCSRSISAIDKIDIDRDIYRNHDMSKIQEIINGIELAYKSSQAHT